MFAVRIIALPIHRPSRRALARHIVSFRFDMRNLAPTKAGIVADFGTILHRNRYIKIMLLAPGHHFQNKRHTGVISEMYGLYKFSLTGAAASWRSPLK